MSNEKTLKKTYTCELSDKEAQCVYKREHVINLCMHISMLLVYFPLVILDAFHRAYNLHSLMHNIHFHTAIFLLLCLYAHLKRASQKKQSIHTQTHTQNILTCVNIHRQTQTQTHIE